MKITLGLLLYLFPTGILCSTLAGEITENRNIYWHDIPNTVSFYLIIGYTVLYGCFFIFKSLIKQKISDGMYSMLNRIIPIMLNHPQMKLLSSDFQEIKILIDEINGPVLPKVLYGSTMERGILCLLSPSTLFSHDTLVSLYTYQDGFEELIAIGRVLVIQNDKKIQIVIQKVITKNTQIINDIGSNKPAILKNILVKPNVPQSYFQYLSLGDEIE
jgi:hypothetical protein